MVFRHLTRHSSRRANARGSIQVLYAMQSASQPLAKALEAFAAIPNLQAALIVLFVVFSVVAGNAVFALHYHRVGKPVWKSLFNPRSFPLLHLNSREWLMLLSVFVASMGIGLLTVIAG
jgi:hypothetical protein